MKPNGYVVLNIMWFSSEYDCNRSYPWSKLHDNNKTISDSPVETFLHTQYINLSFSVEFISHIFFELIGLILI